MEVVLEHVSGTAINNLQRAKVEMNRVLAFRGSVTSVKAGGTRIIMKVEINPKWDLSISEKVSYLQEWIPAKVRTVFKVHEVYRAELCSRQRRTRRSITSARGVPK
jgi:hypothetical protein